MKTIQRHSLDQTFELLQWRTPFVALEVTCSKCRTPLLLVGSDVESPERMWIARLDARLHGEAVQLVRDRDTPGAVHKVVIVCQQRGCTGEPQVTRATIERHLAPLMAAGRHAVAALPI